MRLRLLDHARWFGYSEPLASRRVGVERRPWRAALCLNFDTMYQHGISSRCMRTVCALGSSQTPLSCVYSGLEEQPADRSLRTPTLPRSSRTQILDLEGKKCGDDTQLVEQPSGGLHCRAVRGHNHGQLLAVTLKYESRSRSGRANLVHRSIGETPSLLRRPKDLMRRQLRHLQDLRDRGGFGFTIDHFFLALRQLLSTSSSRESSSLSYTLSRPSFLTG
ncbi:hypothetical protein BJV78DRAFT_1260616 [Lactifluus subvellereus]|nr:hypothetical protein BJV78DRAFT_1260616 [Lactifluus subvellereus]